jgi:hypothetical protein
VSDPLVVTSGWWYCPRCNFFRHFATEKGALRGIGEHMRLAHDARVVLKTWAGPRRLFDSLEENDG